jgi:hypothetical protein
LREKQNKMIGNSPLLARAKPSLFLLLLLLLLAPAPTTLFQFPSALFTVGSFFSRATRPAQGEKNYLWKRIYRGDY